MPKLLFWRSGGAVTAKRTYDERAGQKRLFFFGVSARLALVMSCYVIYLA
jgi:hypothetical protein